MLKSLSIVLPVRDAAGQLQALAADCLAVAARHTASYELIIVVDGGDDATRAEASRLADTHAPVVALHYRSQRGFRRSLHDAWGLARGDHILVLDPGQVQPAELARLLALADGHAAVFGARPPSPRGALRQLLGGRTLRDPALRLVLARAELRELIAPAGPDDAITAEIAEGVRRRDLAFAEVDVNPRRAPSGEGQRTALGLGMVVVAGCLWLLRRLLPGRR